MGFAEATPLLSWVNEKRVALAFDPRVKLVYFSWPPENGVPAEKRPGEVTTWGSISYNPTASFALSGSYEFNPDQETLAGLNRHLEGAALFAQGKIREALERLEEGSRLNPRLCGSFFSQAVCLARLGNLEAAAARLEQELAAPFPHARAAGLHRDIAAWLAPPADAVIPPDCSRETPPLTIFAMPKAFQGRTGIIQRNAIKSWTLLQPRPEIILFGNDPGVADAAREFQVRHVPQVATTEHGAPLVSDLFRQAQALATTRTLAYVNADIILGQDFVEAARAVEDRFPQFLVIGQRFDLEIAEELDFNRPRWREDLRERVSREGALHAVSALDYFIFTPGLWPEIPDFALGRTAWDNWLAAQPLKDGLPLVNATAAILAVHQNHDYQHVPGGDAAVWRGAEARHNQELAWASPLLAYTSHATWQLSPTGLTPNPRESQAARLAWEGAAFLDMERWEKGLNALDEGLQLKPEGFPGLHFLRGRAWAALGRRAEAVETLKLELAPHPTHHPARRLLDSLEQGGEASTDTCSPAPRISIVIPTYNRSRYLGQALESALTQEYGDLEVVVVDDGSTDDTPELMARFTDPRLRYVRKAKTNAPDTRNHGIAAARGEWLLWLDSDDVLLPGWLARLATALEAGDEADVYYGNLEVVDPQGRRLQVIRYENFAGRNDLLLGRLVHGNPLPLPGSLFRKTLLTEAGGFDVDFRRAHDYELYSRLAPAARFCHLPFLAIRWRWHDDNMSSGSVHRDLSFDAKVVQRLLTRHPLKELFPDLPWDNWPLAQAQAARRLGEIFSRYGDLKAAREWLAQSGEPLPPPPPVEDYVARL